MSDDSITAGDSNNYIAPATTNDFFTQNNNCDESITSEFSCADQQVTQLIGETLPSGQSSDSEQTPESTPSSSPSTQAGVQGSSIPPGNPPSTSGSPPLQDITKEDLNSYGKQTKYILGSNANGISFSKFVEYGHPTVDTLNYSTELSDLLRYNLGSYWGERTVDGESRLEFFYDIDQIENERPIEIENFRDNNTFLLKRTDNWGDDYVAAGSNESGIDGLIAARNDVIDKFKFFVQGGMWESEFFQTDVDPNYQPGLRIEYPGILKRGPFRDFSIIFNAPYSEKEKNKTENVLNSLTYNTKTDYVFYDSKFEKFSSQEIIKENQYPNLYISSFYKDLENPTDKITDIYTFDGFLDPNSELNKNYFHSLIDANQQNPDHVKEVKNIFFSVGQLKKLNSFNSTKYLFPMYSEISFSLSKTRKFSNILKESGFLNSFCKELAKRVIEGMWDLRKYAENLEDKDLTTGQEEQLRNQALEPVKYIDFNSVYNLCKQVTNDGDLVVIDDSLNNNSDNKNLFLKTINDLIFKQKKKKLEEQKKRTFKELIETGKNCYSETLMYRIAKFKGNDASGEPIQNIFIINEPDTDIVDYVDTQVKYDQEYTYRIFSYEVIIGNKYEYTNRQEDGDDFIVTYKNDPETVIVELPYLDQTVRIYDSPPPPPEVSIEYYKGNERNLLIMMNSSANTYKAKPVLIDEKDEEMFKKASQQQQVEFGEKIEFSSDDKINKFQIFRTDVPPDKFEDFNGQLIKEIEAVDASSAAFVDSILPNKKYYYTFRSVDVHDKVSNPTDVYEIEMISEKGTIFAIKNIYSLKRQPKKSQTRSLKRFLRIRPTISHELINNETEVYSQENLEQALEKANLGLTEKSVWSKKFKLRLVSKNSNKVLDVNFKFDTLKQQYSVNNSENN